MELPSGLNTAQKVVELVGNSTLFKHSVHVITASTESLLVARHRAGLLGATDLHKLCPRMG